jgi:peptidoglycan hydrolase CwlO-like protein
MSSEIITALVGLFCTTVSSIVTFILTRRKYNTEVDSQQIKNMDESFEIYKKVMNEAMATQNTKIELLQRENENLRNQVNRLQAQIISLIGMMRPEYQERVKATIEPLAMKDM